jgi:shikimate dehydrogenase
MKHHIGIIGYPVKYSLSPYFQQAAIDHYHLDINYEIWETPPGKLADIIGKIRTPMFLGANITSPYKSEVISLLDETDQLSTTIGAVNTVVKKGSKLFGVNTDISGFTQSLVTTDRVNVQGKTALILGAGGVARAVAYALIIGKASTIAIANRTVGKAISLVDCCNRYCSDYKYGTLLKALSMRLDELHKSTSVSDIIVNCTTIGMKNTANETSAPLTREMINPHTLICDLVYNPSETVLLKMAKEVGAQTLNGLPMLIYQGAESFHYWTKKKPPVDIMFDAARKALSALEN